VERKNKDEIHPLSNIRHPSQNAFGFLGDLMSGWVDEK